MSKTVTVRRGEKLPENMVAPWVATTVLEPRSTNLKPGDVLPSSSVCDSITVEVPDDSPLQAYLIVPCEPGKGTHWHEQDDAQLWGCTKASAFDSTHKQIPCALTLEDLRQLVICAVGQIPDWRKVHGTIRRLEDTIAAWSAVSQAKEAGK